MSSNMSISGTGGFNNSSGYEPVTRAPDTSAQQIRMVTNAVELQSVERQGVKVSLSDEQLIKAIDRAVKALQGPNTECEVSIHEKTKQLMIKVIDKDNGTLIREIPPEKTLDMVAKLMEVAGILIDERV